MNFSAAEIVLVISNKPDVQGLKRAENAGIATKVGCDCGNEGAFSCYYSCFNTLTILSSPVQKYRKLLL